MLEQLSCHLCQGYLIDATTIDECMDSFCKSCIIKYLRTHSNCPKCGTHIHETNTLSAIRSDKVLQDIVYKLVPGLYDDEMKRRRDFYRGLIGSSSSEDDDEGSSGSMNGISPMYNNEKYGVISYPKQFYKPTDSIDLSIEPHTRGDSSTIYFDNRRQSIVTNFTGNNNIQQQQQLLSSHGSLFSIVESHNFKTYLRCPAKLTALQLKKLIAAKFNICRDDTIHLWYLNESLKDAYSLIDIAYIYDWRGIEHMRLFYKIERNLSSTRIINDSPRTPKTVSRQSVGTSTQTIKRVCIDPNPKYYEVQCATAPVNTNGRSMRPRDEGTSNGVPKRELPASSPSPILRSSGSSSRDSNSQTSANRTVATNTTGVVSGFKSRELANLGAGAQGARQSQFTDAVTTAIDELSRLKQDRPKDTRSSRSSATCDGTASRITIPKLNINIGSLDRSQTYSLGKSNLTYGKNSSESGSEFMRDINSNQVVVSGGQAVPHYGQLQMTQVMRQPQSSIVTLASFAQTHNNHIVAVSHSTTTSISSATKDYPGHQQSSSSANTSPASTQQPVTRNQPKQLAFSIVTERGITIVRRPDGSASSPASSSSPAYPGSSPPESCANNQSTQARQLTGPGMISSKPSSTAGGSSPKNHLKVKPVYKLLADPSKIKSPNHKKLGTARH